MALSEIELIQRTLDGDESAYGFLVDKYKAAVHALAYRKLGDFHHAEEITQDTFLKAYQKLSTLRDPHRFSGWLYVIAARLCLSWRRKERSHTHAIDNVETAEMNSMAVAKHADQKIRDDVRDTLENLPESERTVLTLHYFAGMTCEEIGRFMGTSRSAILNRLYRARRHLKEEMTEMIQQTSGAFQLPYTVTQQIIGRIRELQPAPPPSSKPIVPWIAVAALSLVALFVGLAPRQMTHFQHPYSLNALEPATLVEVIDAPIIDLPVTKPALVNRLGTPNAENTRYGNGASDNVLAVAKDSQNSEWMQLGWTQTNGPYGGEIRALHATPEGVIFAGTDGAGIFRSTDGGDFWTPVNTGLSYHRGGGFLPVNAFAHKGNSFFYSATSGGLYISTNGGDSWRRMTHDRRVSNVSGVLFINNRLYISIYGEGVWYTEDNGESWIPINDGLENLEIRKFAAMGTTLFAGTEKGAFRRRASEYSWTPINAGFTVQPINTDAIKNINKARIESGADPLPMSLFAPGLRVDSFTIMGDALYMGLYMGGKGKGLFRSDDEGDSWTGITGESMNHTVQALAASGTMLYASTFGGGVFRSGDGGDSWTEVNDGLTNQTVSALLTVSEKTVFVGTHGGVFRSTDSGDSWIEVNNGLTNTWVDNLAVVGQTVYADLGERLVRSDNAGKSWTPIMNGATPARYTISELSDSGGKLYAAAIRISDTVEGGIYQLDAERNSLIEHYANRRLISIASLEIVGRTFYVGTRGDGVFRWEEGADSWTNLGLEGHAITALSVFGKTVHVGTLKGEIFRLKDTEESWELINEDMKSDGSITELKWIGTTLYASTWNVGVFRSIDGGDSWIPVNDGLVDTSVMTLCTDGSTLFAGTYYNGVFRLAHDKNMWEPVGSIAHRVESLAVVDGVLYAGTTGRGVFRISLEK